MLYRDLSLRLKVLIAAQTALALLTVAWCWTPPAEAALPVLTALVVCGAIGGICKVDLSVRWGRLSLGFTIAYFTLLLYGVSAAALVGLIGALAGSVCNLKEERRRINFRRLVSCQTLYNCANGVLAMMAAGALYVRLGGRPGTMNLHDAAWPVLASALAHYLVNTGGVSLAVGWSTENRPLDVFRKHFAWAWPGFLASASVSAALVSAYQFTALSPAVLLAVPPALLVYYLFRFRAQQLRADVEHMRELNRLNDSVIQCLAAAIQVKDGCTHSHVYRVREYALHLGNRLGATQAELQALRIASLLHDIGKIGIPEQVLCKQGKLTGEEYALIQSHVEIGVRILEKVQFPWPVVPVVRGHHERWDGLGYPDRLRGEEIPLGARILSVADVYDALTSERPYRKAIPPESAVAMLRANSGSQFDPAVVEAFIALLPEMDQAIRDLEASADVPSDAETAEIPTLEPAEANPEDDEAFARLTQRLQSAATLDEAIAHWLEPLAQVVPYAAVGAYLLDPESGCIRGAAAGGMWEELVQDLEIRLGEGVSGRAAEGASILNGVAAADLARRVAPGQNLELNSTLSVPLRDETGALQGALTLYHSSYNFYQPLHQQRLERIAALLAPLLSATDPVRSEQPVVYELSEESAEPERAALVRFVNGQTVVSRLRDEPFSLVLAVVDAPPLTAADPARRQEVLERLRPLVAAVTRDGDLLAGGLAEADFAVVLPGCDAAEAENVAMRIAEQVRMAWLECPTPRLAARVSVSVFPGDGGSAGELIQAAVLRLPVQEPPRDRPSGPLVGSSGRRSLPRQ